VQNLSQVYKPVLMCYVNFNYFLLKKYVDFTMEACCLQPVHTVLLLLLLRDLRVLHGVHLLLRLISLDESILEMNGLLDIHRYTR
jgi:hypothetical protein